jgi:hypothetical protein
MFRQEFVQLLMSCLGELGQFTTTLHQRVRGQHSGASGVGDDRQPSALRTWLLRQCCGNREHFGNTINAQDTDSANRGIECHVATGQRTGVRCGGKRP